MNIFLKNVITVIIALLVIVACSKSPVAIENNDTTLREVKLKYEKVCTLPNYGGQTMMISNYENNIIVSGCYYIQRYDTLGKNWQIRQLINDSVAARWDGAFCRLGNLMYLFGPTWNVRNINLYKVVKMDPISLNTVMLNEPLPFQSNTRYPAYTVFENKMIAVYPALDSVYVFDGNTEKGKFVAPNFAKINNYNSNYRLCSGQYNNHFLIFNPVTQQFFRINLYNYSWETIPISNDVAQLLKYSENDYVLCGGVTDNLLVIIKNTKAICYNIDTNEWFTANNDIKSFDWWTESVSQSGNSFYFNAWLSGDIWKISKAK